MSTEDECAMITSTRRNYAAVKASLKHLDGHVPDLEARGELTIDNKMPAQLMLKKLNSV